MNLLDRQRQMRDWLLCESGQCAADFGAGGAPGLAVYLNTYRGQLMGCLAETYPCVRAWLGAAAFDAAAALYIDQTPPTSWTLDAYALGFPEALHAQSADHPEVVELASLERALALAFTGPDSVCVDVTSLAEVDWDRARLQLAPTFALLSATTNAAAIWQALSAGLAAPPPVTLAAPAALAVWRRDFTPRFRTLDPAEAQALACIVGGMGFAELCGLQVERFGGAAGPAQMGIWLGHWLSEGLVAAVT